MEWIVRRLLSRGARAAGEAGQAPAEHAARDGSGGVIGPGVGAIEGQGD